MLDKNYITIQGWMINQLNLKGNELLTYAIIYGFSQDGETWFKGSIKYISEALQVSRPTAIKILDALTAKGLIEKKQENINDVKFNRYKINLQVVKKLYGGSKETLLVGSKETLLGGSKETLPSNTNTSNTNTSNTNKGNKKAVYFPLDEKLDGAFKDYVAMRKQIKAPMTDRAIDLAIKKLEELAKDTFGNMDNDKAVEIINQSIMNSWKGLFPLKEEMRNNFNSIKKSDGTIDWDNV